MDNTFEMSAVVLEDNFGSFKDESTGKMVEYSSVLLRIGGREVKLKTDVRLGQFVEKEVTLVISLTAKAQKPVLKVVDYVK